jgi:hypothetical protein
MMALTLTQPWASLVAIGAKQWETRSWPAKFRGQLAIHAAKGFTADDRRISTDHPLYREALSNLPFLHPFDVAGSVLAIADLTECRPTEEFFSVGSAGEARKRGVIISAEEFAFGNFDEGRFAFKFENVRRVTPIRCRGALNFWRLPDAVELQIREELDV